LVVFSLDFSQCQCCCCLLVDKLSKACLAFDKAVRDTLLSAESRQENHKFNWVHIMSNNYKLSFAFLNQLCHVVQTKLDVQGLWTLLLVITFLFSLLEESGFFFFLVFWTVFCQKFKELSSLILVNCVAELVDGWRHLQSL